MTVGAGAPRPHGHASWLLFDASRSAAAGPVAGLAAVVSALALAGAILFAASGAIVAAVVLGALVAAAAVVATTHGTRALARSETAPAPPTSPTGEPQAGGAFRVVDATARVRDALVDLHARDRDRALSGPATSMVACPATERLEVPGSTARSRTVQAMTDGRPAPADPLEDKAATATRDLVPLEPSPRPGVEDARSSPRGPRGRPGIVRGERDRRGDAGTRRARRVAGRRGPSAPGHQDLS